MNVLTYIYVNVRTLAFQNDMMSHVTNCVPKRDGHKYKHMYNPKLSQYSVIRCLTLRRSTIMSVGI